MLAILEYLFGNPGGLIAWQLLAATRFTIYLSIIAFLGGGLLAGVICFLRMYPFELAKRITIFYIWLFQSTPLLMLLFLIGLGVPRLIGIEINPWLAATIALCLFTSAYLAEVWRGAIGSVPVGQWEAARSLGLSFRQIFFKIIIPQAFRLALGPTIGFLVQIVKGTSLAYIIGFSDLMLLGKRWANSPVPDSEPFIIFPAMALIYFGLCYPLSRLGLRLEKRHNESAMSKGK